MSKNCTKNGTVESEMYMSKTGCDIFAATVHSHQVGNML